MPPVQTRLPPSSPPTSSPTSSRPRAGIMPAHPAYPSGSASASASSSAPYVRPPAPYMVALSGWPEPVYISNRSRPSTPRPSFPGEQGDGVVLSSPTLPANGAHGSRAKTGRGNTPPGVPAESIFSKACMYDARQDGPCPIPDHPNHVERYSTRNAALSDTKRAHEPPSAGPGSSSSSHFPTSSTRTPTHSPPLRPAKLPHYNATPSSRYGTFRDPRMAPNVGVLSNRAPLPIAPGWASSASTSTPTSASSPQHHSHPNAVTALPNVGVKVPAGERGTGILVLSAVPDVYPPAHVPRDGGPAGHGGHSGGHGAHGQPSTGRPAHEGRGPRRRDRGVPPGSRFGFLVGVGRGRGTQDGGAGGEDGRGRTGAVVGGGGATGQSERASERRRGSTGV